MNLPHALDDEFRRVAKAEEMSMEDLMSELSGLTGYSARQLYNFRSGKWKVPADVLPVLCRRLGSRALLDALIDECSETRVDVPDGYDLTRLISRTVREDLKHYEHVFDAFESSGIDQRELDELRRSGERVIQNVRQIEAIAEADFQRRQAAQTSR